MTPITGAKKGDIKMKEEDMRMKVDKISTKAFKMSCRCAFINRQLVKLHDDLHGVCCPSCCDCAWQKIDEQIDNEVFL